MNKNVFVILLEDSSTELADANGGKFQRFWKQIVKFGDYVDPNNPRGKMRLNKSWADRAVQNFKDKVAGRIPVPVGHPKGAGELATANRGELMDMSVRDDGIWGLLEIRDGKTAQDIEDDRLWDVSISFDDHYVDKKTGKDVGPTILHVGLVDNPYLKGMEPFQALGDAFGGVMLSESANNNNGEEPIMTKVKNERDFEVTVKYKDGETDKELKVAAGAEVEVPEAVAEEVTKQFTDATAPAAEETEAEKKAREDKEAADAKEKDVADREAAAAKKEEELAEKEAGIAYQTLLSEGKIVPAQKDTFMALSRKASATVELSDGSQKTVGTLLAELFTQGRKVVALDDEQGGQGGGGNDNNEEAKVTDEETSLASSFGNTPEEIAEYKKDHPESN